MIEALDALCAQGFLYTISNLPLQAASLPRLLSAGTPFAQRTPRRQVRGRVISSPTVRLHTEHAHILATHKPRAVRLSQLFLAQSPVKNHRKIHPLHRMQSTLALKEQRVATESRRSPFSGWASRLLAKLNKSTDTLSLNGIVPLHRLIRQPTTREQRRFLFAKMDVLFVQVV